MKKLKVLEVAYDNIEYPMYEVINRDWNDFVKAHPEYTFEVRGNEPPAVLTIINKNTGEVWFVSVIDFSDSDYEVKYRIDGEEYEYTELVKKILEEMK